MSSVKRALAGIVGMAALAVTFATPAFAVSGTLPGGTDISVAIDSPANGAVLPPGAVTVAGTASVGKGVGGPDTSFTYVLDLSGSTDNPAITGCPDVNGANARVLDCEITAAVRLNDEAAATGSAVGQVSMAAFASNGKTADLQPAAGPQLSTGPGTDASGNGRPDIVDSLVSSHSVFGGDGTFTDFSGLKNVGVETNFHDGFAAAAAAAADSSMPKKVIIFLSDGTPTIGGPVDFSTLPPGAQVFTFAVGGDAQCNVSAGSTSLEEIAAHTGRHCTTVPDPTTLPDIVPQVIGSKLLDLRLRVDGQPAPGTQITNVTPPLPQDGPASVNYTVNTPPLGAGTHTLCVTAFGSDRGDGTPGSGNGDVTDCHTITINAAPIVHAGGPYAGAEGTPVAIAGDVTDPDSPGVTSTWTIAPGPGVDAGTTCSFGDLHAVSTTVTCTDDGTFTLTLTADDGVNAPVSSDAQLTLTNVAPSVSFSAPANGALFARGVPVSFTAPFTDIGTNDKHTCTLDFADGTPVTGGSVSETPGSGTCASTHAFTALGAHNVLVRVTDDDGDAATAVVTVVIFLPGEAFALQASGPITIAKTPLATCPPDSTKTIASINAGIGTVNALNASCTINPNTGTTVAASSVDNTSLLGGLIKITAIQSSCTASAAGITGSSRVGTINGVAIGTGSGSISIPLVAQVFFNETTTDASGRLVQNAVRVHTLLGQEIILAGCRLG